MRNDTVVANIEIVINVTFGGFSIDTEMALWLIEHRGWVSKKEDAYDYTAKDQWPLTHLIESGSSWIYSPHSDSMAFRMHKDIIDCVQALQEQYKDDGYQERRTRHVHHLKVIKAALHIDVEDYHDGKERVHCWHTSQGD